MHLVAKWWRVLRYAWSIRLLMLAGILSGAEIALPLIQDLLSIPRGVFAGLSFAAAAVALVGGFEGLRNYAYRDPVGIPTICFGETRGVKMGDYKTTAACKSMLGDRLVEFETGMVRCLTAPDKLPDPAYTAFLSFTYNVGTGAFCKSTLVRKVNAGDLRGGCDELLKWDKAAGIRLPGLTKRRQQERALCLQGVR